MTFLDNVWDMKKSLNVSGTNFDFTLYDSIEEFDFYAIGCHHASYYPMRRQLVMNYLTISRPSKDVPTGLLNIEALYANAKESFISTVNDPK